MYSKYIPISPKPEAFAFEIKEYDQKEIRKKTNKHLWRQKINDGRPPMKNRWHA